MNIIRKFAMKSRITFQKKKYHQRKIASSSCKVFEWISKNDWRKSQNIRRSITIKIINQENSLSTSWFCCSLKILIKSVRVKRCSLSLRNRFESRIKSKNRRIVWRCHSFIEFITFFMFFCWNHIIIKLTTRTRMNSCKFQIWWIMMNYKKLRRLLIELRSERMIYNIKLSEQNEMMNTINDFSKAS